MDVEVLLSGLLILANWIESQVRWDDMVVEAEDPQNGSPAGIITSVFLARAAGAPPCAAAEATDAVTRPIRTTTFTCGFISFSFEFASLGTTDGLDTSECAPAAGLV